MSRLTPLLLLTCVVSVLCALGMPPLAAGNAQPAGSTASPTVSAPQPNVSGVVAAASAPRPPALPPGAHGDPFPSEAIFPPQRLARRFDHRQHLVELEMKCLDCHQRAKSSNKSADRLLPSPLVCDGCHESDHSSLNARVVRRVMPTTPAASQTTTQTQKNSPIANADAGGPRTSDSGGQDEPAGGVGISESAKDASTTMPCADCHVGGTTASGALTKRTFIPTPNLKFSHNKHFQRNIACAQCHGDLRQVGLATRAQMPRMQRCLDCHHAPAANRGEAKGACPTCHLSRGDTLITKVDSGSLLPPPWLGGAQHGADFAMHHAEVAAADSALCANCHQQNECVACHDGRLRPRNVHPNDWLNLHAMGAQQDPQSCGTCHRAQSFCVSCHQRAGQSETGPGSVVARGSFHPPPEVWTNGPKTMKHHSTQASRNLSACISCHTERDCVQCHSSRLVGGSGRNGTVGVNPHRAGFLSRCSTAWKKNRRACLSCHSPDDSHLYSCGR